MFFSKEEKHHTFAMSKEIKKAAGSSSYAFANDLITVLI